MYVSVNVDAIQSSLSSDREDFERKKSPNGARDIKIGVLSDLVILSFSLSSKAGFFCSIWKSGFLLSDSFSRLISPLFMTTSLSEDETVLLFISPSIIHLLPY
jgi:hypothetical protein